MAERNQTRRRVIRTVGIAALAGLAGCSGVALPGNESTPEGTPTSTEAPTTTGETTTEETTTGETTAEPDTTTGETTPYAVESVHFHGTMVATINEDTFHFGDKPWNMEERTGIKHFHFHSDGKQDTWHVHSKGVTLGYAFGTMPEFEVTEDGITFRGYTYESSATGTEIAITANGEEVEDIDQYLLESEDEIEIDIETDAEKPTPGATTDTAETPTASETPNGTATTTSPTPSNGTETTSSQPSNSTETTTQDSTF